MKRTYDIFFDFNLPITTNETLNTIVPVTSTDENSNATKPCLYNVHRVGDRIHLDFPEIKQRAKEHNVHEVFTKPLNIDKLASNPSLVIDFDFIYFSNYTHNFFSSRHTGE